MTESLSMLVVDDEPNVCFFLKEVLEKAGHRVTTLYSGEEALSYLRDQSFNLVIVDLKLGGAVDGLRVLEAVKWRWPDTSVIILTAHGSLESAMTAIRVGVDGYLLKPVEPEDVRQAIVEVLGRRRQPTNHTSPEDSLLNHGDLSLNTNKHQATLQGKLLDLTPNEFTLLAHFLQNAQKVVTPSDLVWALHRYEADNEREAREIVKWYIYRLRRKIEPDPENPRYILNVRGVGYTLGPPILS